MIMLPNLRVERIPTGPWVVNSGINTAKVTATRPSFQKDDAVWSLQVLLNGTVLKVSTPTPGAEIQAVKPQVDGTTLVNMQIRAPTMCPLSLAREPVELNVNFKGRGREAVRFEIDHRCLLGDILSSINAVEMREVARHHWNDPVLRRILASAPRQRGSVDEELRYFKTAIGFGPLSLQKDPIDEAPGWRPGSAYILAPLETARLGGDCDDYAIFAGLYFAQRGFPTQIAMTYLHVWLLVNDNGASRVVDLVADPNKEWPPSSTALITEK